MKFLTSFFLVFLFFTVKAQTNYSSAANGDYDVILTWDLISGQAPDPIPLNDTVFICHNVTLTADLDIDGVLFIKNGAVLDGPQRLDIGTTGTLINNGRIEITDQLGNDGEVYNNGYLRVENYHDDGYTCNTDTIELDNGEKYDCHGCTLECGGTILACEIKTRDNGGNSSTIEFTDICCDDGSDPIFDINGSTTIDSASVYSCGTALDGSSSLPIALLHFIPKIINQSVFCNWTTASEKNNDFFTVWKSNNGIDYREIGIMQGAGTSSLEQDYQLIDFNLSFGISYYKLSQTDFDGTEVYFKPKSVFNKNTGDLIVYHNNNTNEIVVESPKNIKRLNVAIYALGGKLIQTENHIYNDQNSVRHVELNQKLTGIYIVRVHTDNHNHSQKIWFGNSQ